MFGYALKKKSCEKHGGEKYVFLKMFVLSIGELYI